MTTIKPTIELAAAYAWWHRLYTDDYDAVILAAYRSRPDHPDTQKDTP